MGDVDGKSVTVRKKFCRAEVLPFLSLPSRLKIISREDTRHFSARSACAACAAPQNWRNLIALGGLRLEQSIMLVACQQCGHVMYSHVPKQDWLDQFYKKTWDVAGRKLSQESAMASEPKYQSLPHLEPLMLPREARILDYGCGFGDDLVALRRTGFKNLFGVEMSEHRAKAASSRFPGRVTWGSSARLQGLIEEWGTFDLIVSRHVFEHLPHPAETLRELTNCLSDNGLICLLVPDIFLECPINTTLFLPHLHLFNRTSMMRMMKRIGLRPFCWLHAKNELVMVGAKSATWQPPESFSSRESKVDGRFIEDLAGFIVSPWAIEDGQGKRFLMYFPPYKAKAYPQGFSPLTGLPAISARFASWIARNVPFANHPRILMAMLQIILRTDRTQFPLPHVSIIGFRAKETSEIPWLSMPNGGLPVLIK